MESDYTVNDLWQAENTSLDETKEKWNDVSVRLNTKIYLLLKIKLNLYIYMIIK